MRKHELWHLVRCELLKQRHTPLLPVHFLLPAIGCAVFLLYYAVTAWSAAEQTAAYFQAVGCVYPLASSAVCSMAVSLEEQNHFQILLGLPLNKKNAFYAKWFFLLGCGFCAAFLSVYLFAAGQRFVLGETGMSWQAYSIFFLILWAGSAPLYLEHLFLNLRFSRTVSMGISVAQLLMSALFLTSLGDGRWQFFPCTWQAKGCGIASVFFTNSGRRDLLELELAGALPVCVLILLALFIIMSIWFGFYGGRQCNE